MDERPDAISNTNPTWDTNVAEFVKALRALKSAGLSDLALSTLNQHLANMESIRYELIKGEPVAANSDKLGAQAQSDLDVKLEATKEPLENGSDKVVHSENQKPFERQIEFQARDFTAREVGNRNIRSRICHDIILLYLDNHFGEDVYGVDLKAEFARLEMNESMNALTSRVSRMRTEKLIEPKDQMYPGVYRITPAGRKLVEVIRKKKNLADGPCGPAAYAQGGT